MPCIDIVQQVKEKMQVQLQLQIRIQHKTWVLQMLSFSWQQTSCNFDLQLEKTTKTKQMADCKLTSVIRSQENWCIEGIFVTLWQQQY